MISVSVAAFGLATILFGVSTSFWLTMLALILIGVFDGLSTIIRNTVRQLLTPDAMRGRMMSITQIFFKGGPQLGEVEAGLVAQAFWGAICDHFRRGGVCGWLPLLWQRNSPNFGNTTGMKRFWMAMFFEKRYFFSAQRINIVTNFHF